jgi:imidazolonepropionase-like amidohydrolase
LLSLKTITSLGYCAISKSNATLSYCYQTLFFMRTYILHLLIGVLLLACSSPSHDLLITHVNVIDVVTGEVLPNRTVAIDGDEITAIYTKPIKAGKDTEVVDGTGKFLIPGLWDMHVHSNLNTGDSNDHYEDTNDLMFVNGITGGREMWGIMAIKRKMAQERAAGKPIIDIYTAGVIIDGSPKYWYGSDEVTDPAEAEALVRCQVAQGADFIKVYSLLDSIAFHTIAKTANELGVPFSGHVPDAVPIADALNAGMLTSEHFEGIYKLAYSAESRKQIISSFNTGKQVEGYRMFLELFDLGLLKENLQNLDLSEHWFCPTMVALRGYKFVQDSIFTADPRLTYLPDYMTNHWKPAQIFGPTLKTPSLEVMRKHHQLDFDILKSLIENKAQIIAGTDFPNPWAFPGFSLHDELEMYVKAGMTPLQALQTATINPAKVMNHNRIGIIEKGKLASLVLLNSNPLEDINAVRDIESVILRGKLNDRIKLDEILAQIKRRAAMPDARKLIEDLENEGNLPESILALENKLESVSEKYHLSQLESAINRLGYKYLREKDFENAIIVFELNTRLYGYSQNVWDSYAEGFLIRGDTTTAIQYYQKALDIYPCNHVIEKRLMALKR